MTSRARALSLAALAAALSPACARATTPPSARDAVVPSDPCSSEGHAALRALLSAGSHPDLGWRDFSEHREAAERFYRTRAYAEAWLRGAAPTAQARALAEILRRAGEKGLEPRDYDGPRWAERFARLASSPPRSGADRARLDLAFTVSVLRFVSDLHSGRVDPRSAGFDMALDPRPPADVLVQRLAAAEDVVAEVAALEPPFAAYRRTLEALRAYVRMAGEDDGERLPVPRSPVEVGEPYGGTVRLARLLRLVGDLAASPVGPESALYEGPLVEAVRRFQGRHGLEPDGRLGRRTLDQLNRPLGERVEQLKLTLERWRWVPRRFSSPPVVVNIPEFRLHAGEPDRRWSLKVVVGKAYRFRTPVFTAEMRHVVFRPFWEVPLSIQREELVPQIAKDAASLAKGGYRIVDRARGGPPIPYSGDLLPLLRSGALRLRQAPGPRNALGAVKFVFPNRYDVYLHGTPSQELFRRPRRDFSHGCIRVEDPVRLAAWVLRDLPGWTEERVAEATKGDASLRVDLPRPIPVLVLYGTALVGEDGEVRFFEDIYGHDAVLARALARRRTADAPSSPAADATRVHVDEVGTLVETHAAAAQRQRGVP